MGQIYMISNKKNGKIYIGQTIRPIQERLEEHRTGKTKGCRAIYNAIQKHGWDNFEKNWYECPDDDLNKHEELMVEVLGTLSPDGYNLKGGGGANGKYSEDSKQKMRKSQLGKTLSEEHKKKIGEASSGRTHTEESKQKIRKAHLGLTHTEETKQKYSDSRRGENHVRSKKVYQYDLDGNFINSFASCGEAERQLKGKPGSSISTCARGDSSTAYNFKWTYDNP